MNYISIKKKFFLINHFFHLSSNRTKMVFCRSFTCSFTNNRRILDEFSQR